MKPNAFGDTTAENDGVMLKEAFVPTADFRSLIESDDRTVVVGRRGTGKSALYLELKRHWGADRSVIVISFAPEDSEVIGFRSLLKPFSTSFNLARASTRLLWRYAMLMEVACNLKRSYKTAPLVLDNEILAEHLTKWEATKGNIITRCRLIAKKHLSTDSPEESVGDLSSNLDLTDVESGVLSILKTSNKKIILLMDRLDEGYEPDPVGIGIITGLVYASIELNKKSTFIRPIIFLRDNIYRALAKEDPDYSRNIEGQVMRLHWDWAQLLMLVAARMRLSFKIDQEKDQRVWDRCTSGDLQGRDGFKRCLQFTLYRPRDLLSLLNESFFCASRQDRDVAVIDDLEYAAKSISVARLEDLWKEYQKVFPSIHFAVNAFANGEPELKISEAKSLIDSVVERSQDSMSREVLADVRLLEVSGLLQGLYSVGFIGVHEDSASTFTFCHDGRTPNKAFVEDDRVLVHPCYWLGLNLSRNALKPDEAEKITDEYDIKISSLAPEMRASKIGSIVAQVGKIPHGRDGENEFENWCIDALGIVFAQHLSSIERHPNGNAVQRRDIVARNRESSEFWRRIKSDYGVRQVLFEVKNYSDMGPTEFRQVQSYLTGQYGRLGFIVTRDTDENLRGGRDLDWVKEIWFSHNVLIIKLPEKYISKMLQKLRSPEKHDAIDHHMGVLLDKYERNYLSIKSTRAAKGGSSAART